jgi:flagellin-like hook-associated protein FlgL
MSDIVLSQGIRSNLLSLQSSAALLDKTQNRLATGKKVNSALDDPLNFFTSGALNTRATDLQRLLDGIGLGIKTIEAADNGLKNITRVVEQLQASLRTSLNSAATNAKVNSGSAANGTLLDWRPDPITNAPKNLSLAATPPGPFTNGDTITFSYTVPATSLPPAAAIPAITIGAASTINDIVNAINNSPAGVAGQLFAEVDAGGRLSIDNVTGGTLRVVTGGNATTGVLASLFGRIEPPIAAATATDTGVVAQVFNPTRDNFARQYRDLLPQITNFAKDSSFNGTNLIYGQSLNVVLNEDATTNLLVRAVVYDAGGLGLQNNDVQYNLQSDVEVRNALEKLGDSLKAIRAQAAAFGSNNAIATARQDFTKQSVKLLETGADNLVVADINEEGANLLALQTRQQLSVQALSLASQSEQAVLRLFG